MKKVVILISLLLILSSFIPQTKTQQTFTENEPQKSIPLVYEGNLYFIRVKLNGKTANLLIDTGAAASLLDINQAKKYSFNYYETPHRFSGLGGMSGGYKIKNYTIEHESTTLKVYPFGADLKHVVDSFKEKGTPIVGLLGSDFLRKNDAIIDYKRKRLIINHH